MSEEWAIRFANWILRTFAPRHAQFIAGAVEYGMRAAARDVKHDTPDYPPDWRTAYINQEGESDE